MRSIVNNDVEFRLRNARDKVQIRSTSKQELNIVRQHKLPATFIYVYAYNIRPGRKILMPTSREPPF